ncbi:MAG: MarR family transcriptional regulator [Candidatus Electryonea clarkiae]|nr:MarR family transcriptional regulator [Candidatus Electryonea clarkiae]MDP8286425.1 MarR family transcriptional regulator [Candidatus Electryonea clarkiae]
MHNSSSINNNNGLHESLGFLVNTAARSMRIALEEGLKCHDVTPTQWLVLKGLNENADITQRVLGQKLFLDNATITRQIDKLEQMDMLHRQQSEDDRRAYRIIITQKGIKLLQKLDEIANGVNSIAMSGVTEKKIQTILNGLGSIRNNLEKNQE